MLDGLRRRVEGKKAVLLGVGNLLRGDDAIGPALAGRLQGKVAATVIDAGDVPENYLGVVTAAQPEVVVIVDAAELGATPGDAAIIEVSDLGGSVLSTHNASLSLFLQVLRSEIQPDVVVLGVQPSSTGYGASMSPSVAATVDLLEELFRRCWPPATSSGFDGPPAG